ncbi:MAG: hypothetical protein ACE37F_26150 [Nannocystaceae bacterium]|nr:hypothetical protein [bacterium]
MTTASKPATTATADTSKPAPSSKAKATTAKAKAPKSKADPATALEGILRSGWSSTLRATASDLKAGRDLGSIARQLLRLADDIKSAARVIA